PARGGGDFCIASRTLARRICQARITRHSESTTYGTRERARDRQRQRQCQTTFARSERQRGDRRDAQSTQRIFFYKRSPDSASLCALCVPVDTTTAVPD